MMCLERPTTGAQIVQGFFRVHIVSQDQDSHGWHNVVTSCGTRFSQFFSLNISLSIALQLRHLDFTRLGEDNLWACRKTHLTFK